MAFDHFYEGQRLGVGALLGRRRFTPGRAAQILNRLLASPTVARACAETRARMARGDSVSVACDEIERLMGP